MVNVKQGKYVHFKGHLINVIGEGKHTETEEEMVVYEHVDEKTGRKNIWIRPKAMFLEEVQVNGKKMPRFKKL